MKNLFITKSRECRSDLLKGHASKPYKRTGIHLLLINCKVTSSEASRPIMTASSFHRVRKSNCSTVLWPTTYRPKHNNNQLPDSFRQPHHSCLDSPPHPLLNSSLSTSPLSSSITPSLFHSRFKTYLFNKSFPP